MHRHAPTYLYIHMHAYPSSFSPLWKPHWALDDNWKRIVEGEAEADWTTGLSSSHLLCLSQHCCLLYGSMGMARKSCTWQKVIMWGWAAPTSWTLKIMVLMHWTLNGCRSTRNPHLERMWWVLARVLFTLYVTGHLISWEEKEGRKQNQDLAIPPVPLRLMG